jgi:hypothetical protein
VGTEDILMGGKNIFQCPQLDVPLPEYQARTIITKTRNIFFKS